MRSFPREPRDTGGAPLLALAACVAGLAAVAAGVSATQRGFLRALARRDAGRPVVLSPVPPAPRIQARPAEELAALRRQEDERLSGWGWADRRAGLARVPIERAMDALAAPEKRP